MQFLHSSKHVKGRNTTNETMVVGLLPYTKYNFSVRMRSSMANVSRYPDLWSPPLETVVRTLPTGEAGKSGQAGPNTMATGDMGKSGQAGPNTMATGDMGKSGEGQGTKHHGYR